MKNERDWSSLPTTLERHPKVGTVIPFSRTMDRDPWDRLPLSVPDDPPRITKTEAVIWFVLVGTWLFFFIFKA